jgi:biotin carboxyl carrier protein
VNVDVIVNSRPWKVALEPAEAKGRLIVTIKGESRVIDASWIDPDTLSLVDGSAVHEVRFHGRDENGAVGVEIGGTTHEAVVEREARLKSRPAVMTRGSRGVASVGPGFSQAIKSPMPGRVVRVLVAIGDRVAARQGVVVVEAMKMENELRTPTDGVVKDILAVPGAAVDTGAVLVVVSQCP